MLQSMGLQRIEHNLATEQHPRNSDSKDCVNPCSYHTYWFRLSTSSLFHFFNLILSLVSQKTFWKEVAKQIYKKVKED